jgi:hypothetical protein
MIETSPILRNPEFFYGTVERQKKSGCKNKEMGIPGYMTENQQNRFKTIQPGSAI